jgi:hypothetical protein
MDVFGRFEVLSVSIVFYVIGKLHIHRQDARIR